ncbi:MAG: DUF1080 domain-containing protein [Planctomycetota bacterium]
MRFSIPTSSLIALLFAIVIQPLSTQAQEDPTEIKELRRPKPGETIPPAGAKKEDKKADKKDVETKENKKDIKDTKAKSDDGWKPLLPKKGLEGWEITDFGIPAQVTNDGKVLLLETGDPLNGINYTKGDFPKDNFEIYLEANRMDGSDFFVGLTFPVGESHCSLIAGGWGGSLVGLSSVDDFDASENATTTSHDFENGRWYKVKLRVDEEFVRAWIDDEEFFRQERDGHEFSTRIEVDGSQPLGFCTFMSKVSVRDFKWKSIGKAAKEEKEQEGAGLAVPSVK